MTRLDASNVRSAPTARSEPVSGRAITLWICALDRATRSSTSPGSTTRSPSRPMKEVRSACTVKVTSAGAPPAPSRAGTRRAASPAAYPGLPRRGGRPARRRGSRDRMVAHGLRRAEPTLEVLESCGRAGRSVIAAGRARTRRSDQPVPLPLGARAGLARGPGSPWGPARAIAYAAGNQERLSSVTHKVSASAIDDTTSPPMARALKHGVASAPPLRRQGPGRSTGRSAQPSLSHPIPSRSRSNPCVVRSHYRDTRADAQDSPGRGAAAGCKSPGTTVTRGYLLERLLLLRRQCPALKLLCERPQRFPRRCKLRM